MRRLALVAVAILAACSKSAPPPAVGSSTVTDSAGVQMVDNAAPAGGVWEVDSLPLTAIGSDEKDPEQQFSRIVSARRLSDGRIAVATENKVLLFAADGKFVRTISKRGEGPGEFRYLGGLEVMPGDTMRLADEIGRQVAFYTPDGKLVREERIDMARIAKLGHWAECAGGFLPDGSRLECADDKTIPRTATNRNDNAASEGDPGPGLLRQLQRQYVMSPSLDTAYTLGVVSGIEQFGIKGARSTMFVIHPFYSWSLTAAGGTPMRIASMTNPDYRIEIWTPQGKLERVIRRQGGRRAPTAEEKTGAATALRKDLSHYRDTSDIDKWIAAVPMPDSLPAAVALQVTDAGDVVVMREGMMEGQHASLFDVFDKSGRWIGELHLPPRVRLLKVGPDYLLYIRYDADDAPHIEVHRLKAPARG